MDELAQLGARLAAALQGSGSEADRLLLLRTSVHGLALFAALLIPPRLLYFANRRRDFEFNGLLGLFGLAFTATAVGHGLQLWGLLGPDAWVLGTAQVVAATFAFGIALALWMHLPDAVRQQTRKQRQTKADITRENSEKLRAQRRAQEEALLSRNLVEQAAIGMALVSAAGTWLHVNEALATTFGLTRSELKKREPDALLGAALFTTEGETVVEERAQQVGGGVRRYRLRVAPIRDISGNVQARLVQSQEIPPPDSGATLGRMRQEFEAQLEERAREATEAAARLEQALAEKQKSEAELAARAQALERHAAQLDRLGTRLNEVAGFDDDTGLLSSHLFAGRLDLALAYAKRFGQGFGVIVLAADMVDDMHASDEGLLAALGAVLRAELRDTDAAARCDEERICVLLSGADPGNAARVAERIRRRLAATPLATRDGRSLRLTCCAGTSAWRSGQSLSEVLGEAAEALRAAQAGGRNRVHQRRATSDE